MRRRSIAWLALASIVMLAPGGCGDDETGAGGAGATPSAGGQGGSGAAGGSGGEAAAGISVMTWNLEDFPKTGSTIELVGEVLGELRPDVVALQEIDEDLAGWQTLDGTLDDYTGVIATSGDGFARVAFLYRHDRINVVDAETLFTTDDYGFPRPMLSAHIESISHPSNDFQIGVVHLKAQLDAESRARRRAACERLEEWVHQVQSTGQDDEVVIVGDFNDRLTQPPQYNVFGPLLDATDGGFLTLGPEQAGDYTFIPFTSFIDHVHVRGDALFGTSSAQVVELDETIDNYVSSISDHRPVVARLSWADGS